MDFSEIANLGLLRVPSHRRALVSRATLRLINYLPEGGRRALFRGDRFHCPVCDSRVARFMRWRSSENEWCPVCASMRRHRFTWLYLHRRTNLFGPASKRVLHVAPEPGLAQRLGREPQLDYLTVDLSSQGVMRRMDITAIDEPDASFDVVLCSHVLEHVPNPDRALSEFRRVLRSGGWAALAVPIRKGPTTGDPSLTDPAERERRFGQHDHFWAFGDDFTERLRGAGFEVETIDSPDIADEAECRSMALPRDQPIFHCRVPG